MRYVSPRLVLFMVCALLLVVGSMQSIAAESYYSGKSAKYVFYFIGDGMGIAQKMATEAFTGEELVLNTFPAQGVTTTQANDRFIIGSAAAATAMGSGQITNIGMIGMAPDKEHVKSVATMAKEQGKKVGIISSVSIDHATPAAFYAHVPKRSMYHYIDHAIATSDFDFFGGGGLKDPNGKRKGVEPRGDAMEAIKKAGYTVANTREGFDALNKKSGKVFAYNAWLQDSGATPYEIDRRKEDISLAEFTGKAIELLDNRKGFFLMVEGGKIDWACHANDAKASILDTVAFDQAVAKAVAFYKKHPKETLIVVTGDHETGGMTLGFAGTKYKTNFAVLEKQSVSFQYLTDEVLKPFKEQSNGKVTFKDIQPSITKYFGLEFSGDVKTNPMVLKPYEVQKLEDAFVMSMAGKVMKSKSTQAAILYGGYDPLAVAITHIVNNKAGLAWTSFKHTGTPVATSAMGIGADSFNGYYHQTELAKKIMAIMGVRPNIYVASN